MGEVIPLAEHRGTRFTAERPPPRGARPVFYFYLGCPFSYLALERVDRLLAGVGWCPTLASELHGGARWTEEGVTGHAVRLTAERRAHELGLPLVWPAGNGRCMRRPMRAALYAAERGRGAQFALAAGRLAFCGGFDLNDPEVLAEAIAAACISLNGGLRAADDARRDRALEEAARRLSAAGGTRLPAIRIGRALHCGERSVGRAAALRAASGGGAGAA
jgi:2-hydroxychromene-2-carboxylate isomerase